MRKDNKNNNEINYWLNKMMMMNIWMNEEKIKYLMIIFVVVFLKLKNNN